MILDFYREIEKILQDAGKGVLLAVIHHEGSSPGRKGFQMFVSESLMLGTIGGGIMEHKLVELAKELLKREEKFLPFVKRQIHQADLGADRSGMICSGEQSVAFYPIYEKNILDVNILENEKVGLVAEPDKIYLSASQSISQDYYPEQNESWKMFFPVEMQYRVHVIGAGHVGLALCRVLSTLDFEILLYDNRPNLNTLEANEYAHSKKIIPYDELDNYIPEGDYEMIVIASFGYRTDKQIVKKLLGKKFKYIGMLGSKAKLHTLWTELENEGYLREDINKVAAPIGVNIRCETAEEIAVSIAAELIHAKNSQNTHHDYRTNP
jgi:xanthine dehydrogenase accessory factor